MGETELENTIVENFVAGINENKNKATEVLEKQMLKILMENGEQNEHITICLKKLVTE